MYRTRQYLPGRGRIKKNIVAAHCSREKAISGMVRYCPGSAGARATLVIVKHWKRLP